MVSLWTTIRALFERDEARRGVDGERTVRMTSSELANRSFRE